MSTPPVPGLRWFARLEVEVDDIIDLGATATGHRRLVPITGGRVSGGIGEGVVLPGGDWQRIHPDGTVALDAQYVLQLSDGTRVEVESRGIRAVDVDATYFRTAIRLTAPTHRDDLNRRLFVSSGTRLERLVVLDVYTLD